jgi:hypothetical protein
MAEKQRTTEQQEKIRGRAYELWEQEGRPHARHREHWAKAEQELELAGLNTTEVQGEGDKTAALAFALNQAEFSGKADVVTKPAAARDALDGGEGSDLSKAAEKTKRRSRGEPPRVGSKSASRRPKKAALGRQE